MDRNPTQPPPVEDSRFRQLTPDEVVESREVTQGNTGTGMPAHTERTDTRGASPQVMWTNAIYLVLGVVDVGIAVRFVLKLLAANPDAGLAAFVYGVTHPFLVPFAGLLTNPGSATGPVLELTSLVAIAIYALLAWLLVRVVALVLNRTVTHSQRDVS